MAYVRLCRDIFPRRRHWRRLLWSTAALFASAVGVLTLLAARYQPLQPGGSGGGSFPGLHTAVGMHWVSKYIPMPSAELYVPPQREPFALAGSVVNSGSFAITIVAVRQTPISPFTAAGPARYLTSAEWNTAKSGQVLRDVKLMPGRGIMIGMPLRITYCAYRRGYVGEDVFLVTERFLGFTHTVRMPFIDYGSPVVTNAPGGQPGTPGNFCGG